MEAQLLYHFTPLDKLPPHSYTILPPLAAQLLNHFTPSEQITPLTLEPIYPLGSTTFTSFYPLWTNYPLILTPFYLNWQPNSYNILPPLDKLPPSLFHQFTPPPLGILLFLILPPHSYTILPPSEAEFLQHFTPSGQINPLTLTPFYPPPPGSLTLSSFYPPLNNLPTHSYTIFPHLAAELVANFTTLWTNYTLTLTPFYPPWQPNSQIILPPQTNYPLSLTPFYLNPPPPGSPTLISF